MKAQQEKQNALEDKEKEVKGFLNARNLDLYYGTFHIECSYFC